MSSLHRTELEVKLNGLQELLDLKKTIYEQVKNAIGGAALAHTQAAMQKKKWHFCGQFHHREGIILDLHQKLVQGSCMVLQTTIRWLKAGSHELIPFP